MNEKVASYPKTELFEVVDTIGVPHPYCIGTGLVAHASNHFNGRLGEAAIESAEKKGIYCDTCRRIGNILKFKDHQQALLVAVKDDRELNSIPELKDYLMSIKEKCEKDGFAGFAFRKA